MVTIMLVTIGAIASILTPIVIQYYNEKQTPFSYQVILIVVLSMLVAYVLQVILIIFRENFASTFNVNYLFQLIEKLINVQYDELIKREPTYLINRVLIAVDSLYLFLISSLPSITQSVVVILTTIAITLKISWKICLLLLLLLPINFFGYHYINKQLNRKMEFMQKQSASTNKDLVASFSNIDYIKSQSNYEGIGNLLRPQIKSMYASLADTNKYAQITSLTIVFMNQVIQNLIIFWISYLIIKQAMPVGNLMLISLVIPMYYSALSNLSQVNIDLKTLSTSQTFIQSELNNNKEDVGEISITEIQSIEINNPSFLLSTREINYDMIEKIVLGDIVYVEGDSGSGKTSLLRLILKFRDSTGITINGEFLSKVKNDTLRKRVGYVTQSPLILSTTLENNIGMGNPLSSSQKKIIEESRILAPLLIKMDWDTVIVENGGNLSGGEQQRIAICRVLIQEVDLIILDESLSNIDRESAKDIMDYLTIKGINKMLIFTSHDPTYKKYANKVINLS